MSNKSIKDLFSHHKPVGLQLAKYHHIQEKAEELAYAIDSVCPDSADKSAAMRKLRECVMTANASIALE
jgi:hypothetical protein